MAFEEKDNPAHDTPQNDALNANNANDDTADNGKTDADNLRAVLGKNISEYRQANGMTRAQLANELDVSEVTIGMYERGERSPSLQNLRRLSKLFEITIDDLIGHPRIWWDDNSYKFRSQARYSAACLFFSRFNDFFVSQENEVTKLTIYPPVGESNIGKMFGMENGKLVSYRKHDNCAPYSLSFANEDSFIDFAEAIQDIFFSADCSEYIREIIFKFKTGEPVKPQKFRLVKSE